MADNQGQITEEIVLELQTNFEDALRRTIGAYSRFQKTAGNISRDIETNINAMNSKVASSLSAMIASAQKGISGSVDNTKKSMRGIQRELDVVNKDLEKFIAKSEQYLQESRKVKELQISGALPAPVAKSSIENLQLEFGDEQFVYLSETYKKLGDLAKRSSEELASSAKIALNSVKESARGIKAELVQAEVAINNMQTGQSVSIGKETIDNAEKQLLELNRVLDNQRKQSLAAEKQVQVAREAMVKQVSSEYIDENTKMYEATVKNASIAAAEYKKTEKAVDDLAKQISSARERIKEEAAGTKEKIAVNIDQDKFNEAFKQIETNFKNTVAFAKEGFGDSFNASLEKGVQLKETLEKNTAQMRHLRTEAVELQKSGLVDASKEISEIDSILAKIKEFEGNFKEIQNVTKSIFSSKEWETQINSSKNAIDGLREKIEALKVPQLDLAGKENIYDITKAQDRFKEIESLQDKLAKERNKIIADQQKIEDEIKRIRVQMTKETNREVISLMEAQVQKLESLTAQALQNFSKAYMPGSTQMGGEISRATNVLLENINKSFEGAKSAKPFEAIKRDAEELRQTFDKLSQKKFGINASAFKADTEKVEQSVRQYKERINELSIAIREYQKLMQQGLVTSGVPLDQMKEQLSIMRAKVGELNVISNRASRDADLIATKASKSIARSAWESVRDFRWQVAAVIYLANKAVMTIRNTFLQLMNDIQKFRTDAMSIGASIAYSVLGDTNRAFEGSFQYAKGLMLKLELQAAKTILTLEDMSMLTKTFTQAGIIPKTDEDVRKISTVGTAIKILTEGMANAGVQMRQELYALIQGRQRAVDQVAMMFKMIGIDINKQLQLAKKEGKSLIAVLAVALEPFNQVYKWMEKEFATQMNNLQIIFSRIKRLAGEVTFEFASRSLEKFNSKLMDSDGMLTKLGDKLAFGLGSSLILIQNTLSMVSKNISTLTSGFGDITPWLDILRAINGAVAALTAIPDAIVLVVRVIADLIAGIVTSLDNLNNTKGGIFSSAGREGLKRDLTFLGNSVSKTFDDFITAQSNKIWDFERGIKSLERVIANAKKEVPGDILKDIFQIDPTLFEDMDKIRKESKKAFGRSLDGVAKIEFEYNEGMSEYTDQKELLNTKLIEARQKFTELVTRGADQKILDAMQIKIGQISDSLGQIATLESNLFKERSKKMSEHYEKERQKIVSLTAEYENLMESVGGPTLTPIEQAEKRTNKLFISVVKFIEKNKHLLKSAGLDAGKLWDAFNLGAQESIEEAKNKMQETFDTFMESMASHKVRNPFQAIDNEFSKIRLNIEKSNDLTDEQKIKLVELSFLYQEERRNLEGIRQEQEKINSLMETQIIIANELSESWVPKIKQSGDLRKLEADYTKTVNGINAQIEKIKMEWTNNGAWLEGSEQQKEILDDLENRLSLLAKNFQKDKNDIIEPFQKEMRDAIKGWADSFTSTLNNVLWDFKSFGDSIAKLAEQIARDITQAFIRQNITNQFMNVLPGLFGGGIQNPRAAGGWVSEPVIGVGLRSGESYSFGERESEYVTPKSKMGGGSAPNVSVNVINQSGQQFTAEQGNIQFDGEKFVMDVFLKNVNNNPSFRRMFSGGR
jgi:DNA repair exonuclease SbcCD ATPase subunit